MIDLRTQWRYNLGMIYVEKLTKIYRSSNRRKCVALDNVTFSLPDKGMVFIVGKSGSGKSTLLNLLGGLDEITSGDISVDDVKFSELKSDNSFDHFRNNYTGFIFQDFHLLSKLTVEQNVRFALELQGVTNDEAVSETLRKVGLAGYEGRYPVELSGGQQQRVAIARAIVKDPRLILADEPTGNLDSVTSDQILDMLKELSEDRLVVVVSHNMESARQYADRIIEMGGGHIVKDITRSENRELPLVRGKIVTLPNTRLSDEQLKQVNAAIYEGGVRLHRQSDIFVPTPPFEPEEEQLDKRARRQRAKQRKKALKFKYIKAKKPKRTSVLPMKDINKFSFKFMNKGNTLVTVLITSFTVVLFVVCLMLYNFDSKDVFKSAQTDENGVFTMQKQSEEDSAIGMLAADKLFRVEDSDIQAFKDAGYTGNIYKLYNMSIPSGLDSYKLETGSLQKQSDLYKKFYSRETLGVLVTEESYLRSVFPDYEVLAGDPMATPYGVIITDYFADSLLIGTKNNIYNGGPTNPYQAIVDYGRRIHNRYKVNAVISTGYKERYATLMEMAVEAQRDGVITTQEKQAMTGTDLYADFLEEAQTKLNIAYSFEPNYIEEVKRHPDETRYFARILSAEVFLNDAIKSESFSGYSILYSSIDKTQANQLKKGEAYITLSYFNTLMGTNYNFTEATDAFNNLPAKPKVTVCDYDCYDLLHENMLYKKAFEIRGIKNLKDGYLYINDEDFADMRGYDVYCYSLMFDSGKHIDEVMAAADKLSYTPNASLYSDLLIVARVMKVYSNLFLTLAVVLLAVGMLVLLAFGIKSVRSRTYEIGIMKALGTGQTSISMIFFVQMLVVGLCVCVVEVAAQFGMIALANSMLTGGLARFMNNGLFRRMQLLTFDPVLTAISLLAVVFITLISVAIPILLLGRIKPIKIIKKKD